MEVIAKTLPQAYHLALLELYKYGRTVPCPDYNQSMLEESMTMVVTNSVAEPCISRIFPGGHHELQQYTMEICDGILDFMIGKADNVWEYTYHSRIGSQLDFVVKELRRNPESRRAVIDIRDNQIDQNNTHPACLQHIQFMIRDNMLEMYVTMRSNDAFEATFMNAFGFIALQKKVAAELNVEVGRYEHRANSFHVYEKNMKQFEKAIDKIVALGYDSEELTYEYDGFYDELMEEEVPNIMAMIDKQKRKYGVE